MMKRLIYLLPLLFFIGAARADLTIQITKGLEGALPVAVVPFGVVGTQQPSQQVGKIIADDLRRSGRFKPLAVKDMLAKPTRGDQVDFRDWRALNQEYLVIGQVADNGPGGFLVKFRLYDVYRGEQITGYSIPTTAHDLRSTAHQISDIIYETLTGQPGAFNTRIAYITSVRDRQGKQTLQLKVADADGYGPQTIVSSHDPLLSPAWSPDGRKIAYVSFENDEPSIWVQDVFTGQRERLTAFPGINGAPAWSPDGQYMALTLSKDGNPNIYIMNLRTHSLRRLTHDASINTEAAWSPDGKNIVFTSNRGGSPQIYEIPAAGGKAKRITFEGNYNARASFSPNGRYLTMVTRVHGNYRIGLLNLSTDNLRILSNGSLDQSPSFAPNGSMIIYATHAGGKGVLATVSTDGRVRQRLGLQSGDVREPAWSPYFQHKGN